MEPKYTISCVYTDAEECIVFVREGKIEYKNGSNIGKVTIFPLVSVNCVIQLARNMTTRPKEYSSDSTEYYVSTDIVVGNVNRILMNGVALHLCQRMLI